MSRTFVLPVPRERLFRRGDRVFHLDGLPLSGTAWLGVEAREGAAAFLSEQYLVELPGRASTVDRGALVLVPGPRATGGVQARLLTLRDEADHLVVDSVTAEADRAGVAPGHTLVAIDGKDLRGVGEAGAQQLIATGPGPDVTLTLDGSHGRRTFTAPRRARR